MRKDYRQNFRIGTNPFGRKSNLQKIAETFGPKKKVKKDNKNKKPNKRMFANKGGGADTGRIGELKSKLAVAVDKIKKDMGKTFKGAISDAELKKIKEMMKNNPKDLPRGLKMDTTTGEGANITKLAKGGSAKKKKKFPDMSGDGKVTMKDVLMARGVIPKKKKTKKKVI